MFVNVMPIGTRAIPHPPASPSVSDLPFWRRRGLNAAIVHPHDEVAFAPAVPAWTDQGGLGTTTPTFLPASAYDWTPYGDTAGTIVAGASIDGFASAHATFAARWTFPGNEGTNQATGDDPPPAELAVCAPFTRSAGFVARLQLLLRPLVSADNKIRLELVATEQTSANRYTVFKVFAALAGDGSAPFENVLDYGQGDGTDAGGAPPFDPAEWRTSIVKRNNDYFEIVAEIPVAPHEATTFQWVMTVGDNNDVHEVAAAVATFPATAGEPLDLIPHDDAIRQSARWEGSRPGPAGLAILAPRPVVAQDLLTLSDGTTTVTASVDAAGVVTVGDGTASTTWDASSAWTAADAPEPLAHWFDVHVDGDACTLHLDGEEVASLTLSGSLGALTAVTLGPLDVEVVDAVLHGQPGYTDIRQVSLPAGATPLRSDWVVQHVEG